MATGVNLEYSDIPAWAAEALDGEEARVPDLEERIASWKARVKPRPEDKEGDVEVLHGVAMTHHFAEAPGDSELLRWHYVEAGQGEPVVFIHGAPESWYSWHHQIATVSRTHRVIAIDNKGYGQSDKRTGDYRHEGVAEQVLALLDVLGVQRFNLIGHDRGAVLSDYLGGNHPDRVMRYMRGEQHLYHFSPKLAPQEVLYVNPDTNGSFREPARQVIRSYARLCVGPVSDEHLERTIQEFSYPQVGWAVPRYWASSSFRKEWIDRRTRLLNAWTFPVQIMQGRHDFRQPFEFYERAAEYIPNGRVQVKFMDAGHFWHAEAPEQASQAMVDFLKTPAQHF